MKSLAIYPGSFDPITLGHLSIAVRASKLFSEVQIVVVHNPNKVPLFSLEERVGLIRESLAALSAPGSIVVETLSSGLLANFAAEQKASAIVKGFRTSSDIEYELPMAQVNRDMSGVETLFLPADPGLGFVSSSLVKEVAKLNGPIDAYVTKIVETSLRKKFAH